MYISNPGDVFYAEHSRTSLTGDLLNQDNKVGAIFCCCLQCFFKALNFKCPAKEEH